MAFGVHSEVGKLRKVMIHRPGLAHTRLTPSNCEDLLFDDVIWVKQAKDEHDAFAEVMRERGVEVFYAEDMFSEALKIPEARNWVCEHMLNERMVGVRMARRAPDGQGRLAGSRRGMASAGQGPGRLILTRTDAILRQDT